MHAKFYYIQRWSGAISSESTEEGALVEPSFVTTLSFSIGNAFASQNFDRGAFNIFIGVNRIKNISLRLLFRSAELLTASERFYLPAFRVVQKSFPTKLYYPMKRARL
jgi:hypothetical protein